MSYLSVRQAASYLGVSRETIYRMVASNNIPSMRVGKLHKFSQETLDQWVKISRRDGSNEMNTEKKADKIKELIRKIKDLIESLEPPIPSTTKENPLFKKVKPNKEKAPKLEKWKATVATKPEKTNPLFEPVKKPPKKKVEVIVKRGPGRPRKTQ